MLGEGLYVAATSLGLGASGVGAFGDTDVAALVGIDLAVGLEGRSPVGAGSRASDPAPLVDQALTLPLTSGVAGLSSILRAFTSGFFERRSVRTPSFISACALSGSTPSGRVNERLKLP